jgi:hypothetical protein
MESPDKKRKKPKVAKRDDDTPDYLRLVTDGC